MCSDNRVFGKTGGTGLSKYLAVTVNKHQLRSGLLFAVLAVAMPILIRAHHFGVYQSLTLASGKWDFGYMMLAVVQLLALNCIRTTPSYLGAIVIGEAVEITVCGRRSTIVRGLFSILVIRAIYAVIMLTSGTYYDLGTPAIITIIIITLLTHFGLFSVSTLNKGIMIALIIIDLQCLTAYPPLSDFGFGRGEISADIKLFATLLGFEEALIIFSTLLFGVMVVCTLIVIKLINDEQRLTQSIKRQQQVEEELNETRYNALTLRTYSEIQHLVHDLKTPLTTVQGLSNLAEMRSEDPKIREWQHRISLSVDAMNDMISEILHENRKAAVPIRDIMAQVATYMSASEEMNSFITYQSDIPEALVLANKTRLVRAIINVIENAATAAVTARGGQGRVNVTVTREAGRVCITVTDNGTGISRGDLSYVWKSGYSTSRSTGLGLAFIQSVVENHGGDITMDSKVMEYTRVRICLEEVAP